MDAKAPPKPAPRNGRLPNGKPATKRAPRPFEPHLGPGADPYGHLDAIAPRFAGVRGLSNTIAQRIGTFANKSGTGAWPNLPRADIAARLTDLAANPVLIDQHRLNACGPAAAMFLHARRNTSDFVDMVISLYDTGAGTFGSLSIKGHSLPQKDPAAFSGGWPGHLLLDWMVLSSLRRSEDETSGATFEFDGTPDEQISGITGSGDMVKWLTKGVGYGSAKDETNYLTNKGLSHLRGLAPDAKTNPVLLINVSSIQSGAKKAPKISKSAGGIFDKLQGKGQSFFPNHWVVLKKPVPDNATPVNVWTWGTVRDFDPISKTDWDEAYFGAVIAKMS